MNISKVRIINPQRYLHALHPEAQFYIAVPVAEEDLRLLMQYGINAGQPPRIPIPRRSATCLNADGKWVPLKDQPKKSRFFVRAYHLKDWQGNDLFGTYVQERQCYQRKLVPPTECAFTIEDGVLYSELLKNNAESMERIKMVMNIALEMVGRFEIRTADKVPALPPVKQVEVPWEILRAGTRDTEQLRSYIAKTVEKKPEAQKVAIIKRHEHLQKMRPEFVVLGMQNFFGYVVYGFPEKNLFIFESNEINNATYVFRGDWEAASRLTKMEVLSDSLQEARIYHTEQWKHNMAKLSNRISQEVE